jgi:predicted ATPase
VKGLPESIDVYELKGISPTRIRFQATAGRGLTRFVGRDHELHQLDRARDQARDGHGQVVAIVGEPGVGKSRLLHEFLLAAAARDWRVLQAGAVSHGRATIYGPVSDLLRAYFVVHDADTPAAIRAKVTAKITALDDALASAASPLLALLDVPVDDPAWQNLDPPLRRRRLLDALKHLMLRESQRLPLLLVFEDLHWADSETQAVLDTLVESLPGACLLLLVNYRPEYQHAWGSKTYYSQLRLDPLPSESAKQLLDALLGEDTALQPLKRLLIDRTEGNPFFLEESVGTLVETKALAGERGAYRLTRPVETIQVPATVQAVLAARIDRLEPEEKSLLQSASVVGKDVPFALLQAIAELPDDALRPHLMQLQAAEFLYETRLFPDLEFTFKHALTHEVAYGGLLQERRRALHARIVENIERVHADRLGEHVEELAHHAERGEQWDAALRYHEWAGQDGVGHSANGEARAHFEAAIAALAHLPASRHAAEQAIDLRLSLRSALVPLREFAKAREQLAEAEAMAEQLGDARRLGHVCAKLGQLGWIEEELDRSLAYSERAMALASQVSDDALLVQARDSLGRALYSRADYARAIAAFEDNVAALRGPLERERFNGPGFYSGTRAASSADATPISDASTKATPVPRKPCASRVPIRIACFRPGTGSPTWPSNAETFPRRSPSWRTGWLGAGSGGSASGCRCFPATWDMPTYWRGE